MVERSTSSAQETISVAELCRRYHVYMPHAEHVAELSAALFDLTAPLHELENHYADVVYHAGLLHNVAYAGGVQKHHTRGRDIILETPLSDLDDDSRALIAVTTAYHRKRWKDSRLETETSYTALSPGQQTVARWLAAIVRMADGLDYSHAQSTTLGRSEVHAENVLVRVIGPYATIDGPRADKKADMWRAVTGIPTAVTVEQGA